MAKDSKIKFKLKGRVATSVSWELPLKTVFIRKKDANNLRGIPRKIQYIPGSDSAFVDDYKGDEPPKKVVFEQGVLSVDPFNEVLLFILFNHPWYNEHYKRDDENIQAREELDGYALIEKALERVNIADDEEAKAAAIVILGPEAASYTDVKVRAELKKKAFESAEVVLEKMENRDYQARFIGALAIMRGVIKVNSTRTSVAWSDGKVIVRVASGQDPIDKLGFFLSDNTEEAKITLQEIGEKVKRSYVRKKSAIESETFKAVIKDEELEEVVPEAEEAKEEGEGIGIVEARKLYQKKFNKTVASSMKNNLEWILNKLGEE